MSNYDLDRLGSKEFEHLVQALLKTIIGSGTTTFGDGPDGGREATYSGAAPYPSQSEKWDGEWIFQAKFHDSRQIGPDNARKQVLLDLKSELEKITVKYKRPCRNYILATNVRMSSSHGTGTHDKIAKDVVPEFCKQVPNIHVWGYDDIARFLDGNSEIRQAYLHFVTPGDLIAELLERRNHRKSALADAVLLYVSSTFNNEQYAQLDRAGDVGERPIHLRRVYVDLDVKCRSDKDALMLPVATQSTVERIARLASKERVSATTTLVTADFLRTVLIGGPGQGKSTLGQFVAQIHRAHLLQRAHDLDADQLKFLPTTVRIPVRIILKDYAQTMTEGSGPHALEFYIASLFTERAAREVSAENIQEIIRANPTLLILDGLDEVTDRKLRDRMLQFVSEFIGRVEDVLHGDLQIIATSRPTGYSDQFDPSRFLHLELAGMDADRVREYTAKWAKAKNLEQGKATALRVAIKECTEDPQFSSLMNTPLQVTIFVLIILGGGIPPRQREELFNEYLEVIYKRERAKSKTIIQTEKRLLFGLHQFLGYLLHLRASGAEDVRSRLKEEEFGEAVFRYLRHKDPYSPTGELRQKASQMSTEAQERLVLLVSPEPGFFGFELRSIQEFFAGAYLVDTAQDHRQLFDRFEAIAVPPHWRNVALFFAGRVGRLQPGSALQVLEACREIDRHKPDYYLKRGSWLALEIALDRSFGPDRILQRSTLEYAMTVLDGPLNREAREQLTTRLRLLSKDDFDDHVRPLLAARIERAKYPEDLATIEVFCPLMPDRERVMKIFEAEAERPSCDMRDLIAHAMENSLPPRFCGSLVRRWRERTDVDLVEIMLPIFLTKPKYAAAILREAGATFSAAAHTFSAAVYLAHLGSRHIEEVDVTLSPADRYEELALAYSIAVVSGSFSYAARTMWHGETRFIYRHRLRYDLPTSLTALSTHLMTAATTELKAASLALTLKVATESGASPPAHLTSSAKLFKPEERETADRILLSCEAPQLEDLALLSRESLRTEQRLIRWLDVVGGGVDAASYGDLFGAFTADQRRRFVRGDWPKSEVLLVAPLAPERGRKSSRRNENITLEALQVCLKIVVEILKNPNDREWRAWIGIDRACRADWPAALGAEPPEFLELARVLESRSASLHGRSELCAFISRLSISKGFESLVPRFLRILGGMGDAAAWDRYGIRANSVASVASESIATILDPEPDRPTLFGYLKWFSASSAVISWSSIVEMKAASFTNESLIQIIQSTVGSVQEGAILLLSRSKDLDLSVVRSLLNLSSNRGRSLGWSVLIQACVEVKDTQEAVSFLEDLLSPATNLPRSIKYAARAAYQKIARTTTVDISEQEGNLGLPFQGDAARTAAP